MAVLALAAACGPGEPEAIDPAEGRRVLIRALLEHGSTEGSAEGRRIYRGALPTSSSGEEGRGEALPEWITLVLYDRGRELGPDLEAESSDLLLLRLQDGRAITECLDEAVDGTYEEVRDQLRLAASLPAPAPGVVDVPPLSRRLCDHLFALAWNAVVPRDPAASPFL